MAPKAKKTAQPATTKKDGANKVAAPKMRLRAPTKTYEGAKEVPEPALQPMEPEALKQMCSWLEWHGAKKVNPDEHVRKLLNTFRNATPKDKRDILSSFKNNRGRGVEWAKTMTIEEVSVDDTETGTVADYYLRIAGSFFFTFVLAQDLPVYSYYFFAGGHPCSGSSYIKKGRTDRTQEPDSSDEWIGAERPPDREGKG